MGDTKRSIDWKYKKAIKEAGFTLRLLENVTGINHALLSMYGNGKYNFDHVERRKIAMALKMPEKEIFSN